MRFKCPFCSFIIEQDDSARGYKISCPNCTKQVIVPITRYESGCIVGDFIIDEKLGEGSIGAVYKATQQSLDRIVALKILYPEYTNSKGIADFLKEARAAARLSHTNIVQSLAVGEENGICYMAMTYITGETLKNKIKREGKLPVDEALHIVQQVAEALYYAWDEAKLIHRDVKPDNIMITDDGIVKLTDLGLAMHQKDWKENMEISGSPSYMSPEQFAGEKLDSRSDIYSLGVTLYQMLSGELPFNGETLRTVATQHFEEEAVALSKLDPNIPAKVSTLVKKMLAKLPDDRFTSMEDLLNNIWTIRQKTAPDKNLVPDVHTISMNRLDYSQQEDAMSKAQNRSAAHAEAIRWQKASSTIYKGLIIAVSLIIVIVFAFIFFMLGTHGNTSKLKKDVEIFKSQIDAGEISQRQLEKNGQILLKQLASSNSSEIKQLHSQVKLYLTELENRNLNNELKSTAAFQSQLEKTVLELKQELSKIKNDKASATAQPTAPAQQQQRQPDHALNTQLANLSKESAELKKELANLHKSLVETKNSYNAAWQNELNIRLSTLISKAMFKEALAFLDSEALKRGADAKKFFSDESAWVTQLSQIYQVLTNSDAKFAGSINDSMNLILIKDLKISYQEPGSTFVKDVLFDEAPLEMLYSIAHKACPDIQEADLRAYIGIIKSNMSYAFRQMPLSSKEGQAFCESIYAQTLDKIRYLYAGDDRKPAFKLAHSILKNLEGSPNYEKIKTDMKTILPLEN